VRPGDTLVRDGDRKRFKVDTVAHWSTIVSDDGEIDHVKWYGADKYVSATKGHTYTLA